MLTRGIIEEIISKNSMRVRIPIYNQVTTASVYTPTSELSVAKVCSPSNILPNFKKGDIVVVGFEDNDIGKPIILGYLFGDFNITSFCDIRANTIEAVLEAKLPKNTTIDNVTAKEISCLQGLTDKVQWQIDKILQALKNTAQTFYIDDRCYICFVDSIWQTWITSSYAEGLFEVSGDYIIESLTSHEVKLNTPSTPSVLKTDKIVSGTHYITVV